MSNRRIIAILFDLDDTLYDCTGSLVEAAQRRAAKALFDSGLPCSVDKAYQLQLELLQKYGPRCKVFEKIVEHYEMDVSLVEKALEAYNSDEMEGIQPFPDVIPTLTQLKEEGFKLALITTGVHWRQERKIDLLNIRKYFDQIEVNDSERGLLTQQCFQHVLEELKVRGDQALMVGDRIHSEIRIAKNFGMTTVQMLHGRYKDMIPMVDEETPDFKITQLKELPTVVQLSERQKRIGQPHVVALGGGTGLPIILTGLRRFTKNLTAVVTVMDSGRSSGRLRNELGILPPGDIRNCLIALSESDKMMNDLFQYRFSDGSLEGMSFGNLLLAAMAMVTGSFEKGLREVSRILKISGRVLPSTLTDTHLCARLKDGTVLEQELNIRKLDKAPIDEVFLKDVDVKPFQEVLDEIAKADLIVMGPGSLFTSVISNLLVPGIPEAIKSASAKKVYICNIVTQPGQTDGFNAKEHIEVIEKYLGKNILDAVIVNNFVPPDDIMAIYESDGATLVRSSDTLLKSETLKIIEDNLVEDLTRKRILWEKQDLLRHDPSRLAYLLLRLLY